MSFATLAGLGVLFLGYALLYKMVKLWGGTGVGFADILWRGCP